MEENTERKPGERFLMWFLLALSLFVFIVAWQMPHDSFSSMGAFPLFIGAVMFLSILRIVWKERKVFASWQWKEELVQAKPFAFPKLVVALYRSPGPLYPAAQSSPFLGGLLSVPRRLLSAAERRKNSKGFDHRGHHARRGLAAVSICLQNRPVVRRSYGTTGLFSDTVFEHQNDLPDHRGDLLPGSTSAPFPACRSRWPFRSSSLSPFPGISTRPSA